MEIYKGGWLYSWEYFFTEDSDDIPVETCTIIGRMTGVNFAQEPFIAACGTTSVPQHCWVVITSERVIAGKDNELAIAFFRDVTAVEFTATEEVRVRTAAGKVDVFPFLMGYPKRPLKERVFQIIQEQWRAAADQRLSTTPPKAPAQLDQLERLAKLLETGAITEEEFATLKARVLS
jgi:hypothetical protein